MQVNMLEAKTQLSKLVEAVLRGEEVVIANRGKPVVKLVKADPPVNRQWGAWAGLMTDEEIDHAFSPEVDAEIAREMLARIDRPIDAGPKPRKRSAPVRNTSLKAKPTITATPWRK